MKNRKRSGWFKYLLGKLWLRVTGWTFPNELPPKGQYILICAPHTSNWDFIYLLVAMFVSRLKISWLGKHTLFKKPFGFFMRWLGGIPIDRRSTHGVVDQIADHFKSDEHLVIAIAPEGTRRKTDHWKSGFYHIATKAQVPLLLGYVDFEHKRVGFGPDFLPSGNMKQDMDRIRAFYKDIRGGNPEDESDIVLREET